nr:kappa-casein - bovine [Bos taurus]
EEQNQEQPIRCEKDERFWQVLSNTVPAKSCQAQPTTMSNTVPAKSCQAQPTTM